jgi:hypothetical protein
MNKGFIYKLVSKDINVKECYIGSTNNTRVRKSKHKSDCNNVNGKSFNLRVYQYIRDNSNFENWELIVLETVQYDQKFELKARERYHMEALGATLNSCVPNRNKAEYYVENAELIKQQVKQYREKNANHIKQHKTQKHDCPCGGKHTHQNKALHINTKKHQKHLEQL